MGVPRANAGSEGKVHLRYLVPWAPRSQYEHDDHTVT